MENRYLASIWSFLTRPGWPFRIGMILASAMMLALVFLTNSFLTERFSASTRSRAEVRQALYSGAIISDLQRNSVVPLLLSRDTELQRALDDANFATASARLISYVEEIGADSLVLYDQGGRAVAATDRNLIGIIAKDQPFFFNAARAAATVFTAYQNADGAFEFAYSRKITDGGRLLGVITVFVNLHKFETSWQGAADAVYVANGEGTILLATEPSWRGVDELTALERISAPSALERAFRASSGGADAWLDGEAVLRTETRIPFQGWRVVTYTPYIGVRERVNGIIALEIMGFAMLIAGALYVMSRRAWLRSALFEQESADLRTVNLALQREIAQREAAEMNLQVAEQTIAQSSKLAALGEMSASVSHELNQPLAAMKTYLAGARLLMERKRPDEAVASFQRIDDLIERMGAITKQLKSYARKGGESFEPVDLRSCISGALTMMEPQLKERRVKIDRSLPRSPVMIMGDRIRIEQVIINLFRNALDAMKATPEPQISILLSAGDTATLTFRDNGPGIKDLEKLFEPFYTTKPAGEGVGLGLAISSGIINDHGGRLTARNGTDGGAVFELQIPLMGEQVKAAE
jgi:two-component system, NtrC family, C4-dicarboxylate transport sensor histidine kinase DctB